MPTMYDTLCKAFSANRERDEAYEEKCRQLAAGFRRGLIELGWPEAYLKWIPWEGHFEANHPESFTLRDVITPLIDEGCDGARLLAHGSAGSQWFTVRPELRLRYTPTAFFELYVGEQRFTGADAADVGKQGAAHYIAQVKEWFDREPESWLKTARPKGTQKALGFSPRGAD